MDEVENEVEESKSNGTLEGSEERNQTLGIRGSRVSQIFKQHCRPKRNLKAPCQQKWLLTVLVQVLGMHFSGGRGRRERGEVAGEVARVKWGQTGPRYVRRQRQAGAQGRTGTDEGSRLCLV